MHNESLDTLHRAYKEFLKIVSSDPSCEKLCHTLLGSDSDGEHSDSALSTCVVLTDWIEKIESALPFIERAVKENRQFILRQGDTVPIEKVRRVSKTSVEHLARHSEYITREPEEENDVIPEKILMTENIGTYAVYENRFLYMLLCYVRDFCDIKYTKIVGLSNRFYSEIKYEKTVSNKTQNIDFQLNFKQYSANEESLSGNDETKKIILRIKAILSSVDALLKTGLMREVANAPMLKPPISRTNVLIQNPCFSAAVELFDYLCAYMTEGYEMKDIFRHNGAMSEDARRDYASLVYLNTYLAYKHAGMSDELDQSYKAYLEKEKKRKAEENEKKIALLKQKLGDISSDTAEYIFALEELIENTKQERILFEQRKQALADAQTKLETAERELKDTNEKLSASKTELAHAIELSRIEKSNHLRELDGAKLKVSQKDDELKKVEANCNLAIEREKEKFKESYSALLEKYNLQSGMLKAKQAAEGKLEDAQLSRDEFIQLEEEFESLKKYYDKQWAKAKKSIRKKELWGK